MEYRLEGNISVKAALLAQRRTVTKIIVDENKKDKDTAFILRKARDRHIPIISATRESIDEQCSGKTHGGLIAYCGERKYQTLTKYMQKDALFLALIEGVEDPFNFGYVLRALYAAGCDGVIIPPRNWTSAADVVTKSSAGASEYIDLIVAKDMEKTLQTLKNQGISLVCALRKEDAMNVYEYTFPKKVCLAIGGELRGLSKVVQSASDQNIFIPYGNEFRNAMTAATSTAILAFEHLRQQNDQ